MMLKFASLAALTAVAFGCTDDEFECIKSLPPRGSPTCIPKSRVMDQTEDCVNGEDEDAGCAEACPAGSHKTDACGGTENGCTDCEAGQFSVGVKDGTTYASSCTPCAAGKYSVFNPSHACAPCTPGTYSALEGGAGATSCILCEAGKATTGSGMGRTECTICSAGSYASEVGSVRCGEKDVGVQGEFT